MEKTKLRKTWLMLTEELENIIDNKEYFLLDKILEKYNIKEEDYIWGISRSYKMDFYYNIFILYCLQENYHKAVEIAEYFNAYDGGYLYEDILADDNIRLGGIKDQLQTLKSTEEWKLFNKKSAYINKKKRVWHYNEPKTDTDDPFTYLKKTIVTRVNQKCFFSGRKLEKGEHIYEANWFYGKRDKRVYFLEEHLAKFPMAKKNVKKYFEDKHDLEDFYHKNFENPFVNYLINSEDRNSVEKILDLIVYGYVAPHPNSWVSLYDWVPDMEREQSERYVYENINRDYITLLWILLKCGYEDELVNAIDRYPSFYGLTLLIFNRSSLFSKVIKKLNLENISSLYLKTRESRISLKEIKKLAVVEIENFVFTNDLLESLERYEYHIYDNVHYTADWYIEELEHFLYAKGGNLLYFFIYDVLKVRKVREMYERKELPLGISSGAWNGYSNSNIFFYEILLYYLAVNNSDEICFWKNGTMVGRFVQSEKKLDKIIKNTESF